MNRPEVLGIITARGGSKSIPKKNLYPLLGKPLILYTIEAAKSASSITRLIISTDDEEIAAVAKNADVEVPFMRPRELAEDLTPDLPVFEHALKLLKEREGYMPDMVVHLRPTTPLKTGAAIDSCVEMLSKDERAHSVRSVCAPSHSPFTMYYEEAGSPFLQPLLKNTFPEVYKKYPEAHNMPRQLLPKIWFHIGDVDVIRTSTIMDLHSMCGSHILPYFQNESQGIDIDTLDDIARAELILKKLNSQL